MKIGRIISILLCLIVLVSTTVFADDSQTISDKIDNIWLSPTKDAAVLENIKKVNQEKMEEDIALYLIAPGYAREKIGISADDEIMREQVEKYYEVKSNEILKAYYTKSNKYARSYASNNALKYLISDDNYWIMQLCRNVGNHYQKYETDGKWYDVHRQHYTTFGAWVIEDKGFSFLKDNEKITEALKEIDISKIQDIKFLSLGYECTCLYIDCGTEEYLIRVFTGSYTKPEEDDNIYYDWAKELEEFKLYNAKDFLNIISSTMDEMNVEKPVYTAEAESLQSEGLLRGNEKGLDLLKPLTRIEATAMLVRAMGYEDIPTSDTSYFADIQSDNWGAKYANIAKDKGIAAGVGDGKFAPDEMITASQFATLILRNMGESPDWQTAINTFVERGLITSEQAEKMDLFTRGDMAKIIYEAKQRNMF